MVVAFPVDVVLESFNDGKDGVFPMVKVFLKHDVELYEHFKHLYVLLGYLVVMTPQHQVNGLVQETQQGLPTPRQLLQLELR